MSDSVELAVRRLTEALESLDAALEARLDDDHNRGALSEQVQAFSMDRSRLAEELDHMRSRGRTLEEVNRAVARRIDDTMETIRTVIAESES